MVEKKQWQPKKKHDNSLKTQVFIKGDTMFMKNFGSGTSNNRGNNHFR